MPTSVSHPVDPQLKPRTRRLTPDEFHRAIESHVFPPGEDLNLVGGEVVVSSGSRPHLWTRAEYYRAAEVGVFHYGERLELIDGRIIEKVSPIGSPHRTTVYRMTHALEAAFGNGYYVHSEVPISIAEGSEPEPDIYVAVGSVEDYEDHHPYAGDLRLVVEVSDSTLEYDRTKKLLAYANAGIGEYWIVNLPQRRIEVHRDPIVDIGYRTVIEFAETATVSPVAKPEVSIKVADVLPRRQ